MPAPAELAHQLRVQGHRPADRLHGHPLVGGVRPAQQAGSERGQRGQALRGLEERGVGGAGEHRGRRGGAEHLVAGVRGGQGERVGGRHAGRGQPVVGRFVELVGERGAGAPRVRPDQRAERVPDLLPGHPGQQPHLGVRADPPGQHPVADAAVEGQRGVHRGGPAGQPVRVGRHRQAQPVGDLGDQPGQVHAGVAGARFGGKAGVPLAPGRGQPQPGDAPADQVQPVEVGFHAARLADHHAVRAQRLGVGHVPGAVRAAVLLVGGEQQAQPAAGRGFGGALPGGDQHGGQRALHVGRTEPVEPVAVQLGAQRVGGPGGVSDRLGVQVPGKHQVPAAGPEVQADQQVRPVVQRGQHGRGGQPERAQRVPDHVRDGPLVARRVGARRPDQCPGQLDDVRHDLYLEAQSWPCQVCMDLGSRRNSQRGWSSVGSRYFGPFSPR